MTDYVIDDVILIRFRLGLPVAEAWWRQIEGSARLQWELITPERTEKALQSLRARKAITTMDQPASW